MPYSPMTDGEAFDFVASMPPHTGKLATVRPDGRPHVAPIWYEVDGRTVIFTTAIHSVKGRNLSQNNQAALCVDDERPPFSFVVLEGQVSMSDDPDDLLRWATRIGGRYMGQDKAERFGKRNAVPEERVVRLVPYRITSARDVAD